VSGDHKTLYADSDCFPRWSVLQNQVKRCVEDYHSQLQRERAESLRIAQAHPLHFDEPATRDDCAARDQKDLAKPEGNPVKCSPNQHHIVHADCSHIHAKMMALQVSAQRRILDMEG
jgi:hypothetical protein